MACFQPDWASRWAVYQADKIAVKEHESQRSLTYRALNEQGHALALYFEHEWGLQKGDRIAILAEFTLEYLLLFVAAQKSGIILVPLNYRLTGSELVYLLNDADPTAIIYEKKFLPLLTSANCNFPDERSLPLEDISQLCQNYPGKQFLELSKIDLEATDPVFILYTSGTTGFPKGALYTHGMLFWNSINTALSLSVSAMSRTITCLPPFHTGGWNVLTTPFLHHGAYIYLMKSFDASAVLKSLEQEKISLFMGVPTMLKMIADEKEFDHTDFSSLDYLIVGGEPMPIPLIEKWHEKKVLIRQGFGMTEVGPNLTSLHQDDAIRKKGSIGRPNFYVQIKIADEQGNEQEPGLAGELLLKGPMLTPGYWRNEAATHAAFQNGWFRSGDRVKMDEEGYLYVVDRIKNMFISGGENVYPAEIERVILDMPSVSQAAVVGTPDDIWGEVGTAFIVNKEDHEISEEEMRAHCKSRLAKFKVPKSFVFISELPKNDTGKINRLALKEKAKMGQK